MDITDSQITEVPKSNLKAIISSCRHILKHISKEKLPDTGTILKTERRTFLFEPSSGICGLVSQGVKAHTGNDRMVGTALRYCFERWPEFSGNFSYPVPLTKGAGGSASPSRAFEVLPHWAGDQLKLRQDLLNFIVETLSRFVEKE